MPLIPKAAVAGLVSLALTGAATLHGSPAGAGRIYAIGDSWAAGAFADPAHALIQDAADDLGMSAVVDGESGSGYLHAPGGTSPYPDRAARIPLGTEADLVILQGGSNDDPDDLSALPGAVTRTVVGVRETLPHARIVMLGPGPDPWPVTAVQTRVDRILAAAAARLHVRYISPLQEGWFTAADVDDIIDPVTHHPTVNGDAVLGARLADDLRHRWPAGRSHVLRARTVVTPGRRGRGRS
ncbi:MAG: SGNH/GDSL hydrolase family protein [Amnibacterium sp.]